MAKITTHVDPRKALTTIVVSGILTAAEIFNTTKSYYTENPTPNLIWDFSKANIVVSCEDLQKVVAHINAISQKRPSGKTAFIKSKLVNAGLGNMFGAFAGIQGLPYDYKIFATLDDAVSWIGEQNG